MEYKLDIIFLFQKKEIKNKKKIDSKMFKFRKYVTSKYGVKGIIWAFGNHYDKSIKSGATWHLCFSNDESIKNQFLFYKNDFEKIMNDFKNKVVNGL